MRVIFCISMREYLWFINEIEFYAYIKVTLKFSLNVLFII